MTTPLMIEIGLHYYARTDDYRDGDHSAPAVSEAIRNFLNGGLLRIGVKRIDGLMERKYEPTDAMTVWVKALCNTPWPVKKWVMPS